MWHNKRCTTAGCTSHVFPPSPRKKAFVAGTNARSTHGQVHASLRRADLLLLLARSQQDLMSLDLVAMAADVEAIAEKATKEAHQENSLAVLQATWERIEFQATASTETDTPLITMTEEDLEVRAGP